MTPADDAWTPLERLARKATEWPGNTAWYDAAFFRSLIDGDDATIVDDDDAALLAAADPQTILSLIAAARRGAEVRAALAVMAPVHVGQMYAATDHGGVQYRADDCLYRGEVLAALAEQDETEGAAG